MATPEDEQDSRLCKVEEAITRLQADVAKIIGSTSTVEMILKWVVLPLLIILGGLIGIKLAMPYS